MLKVNVEGEEGDAAKDELIMKHMCREKCASAIKEDMANAKEWKGPETIGENGHTTH